MKTALILALLLVYLGQSEAVTCWTCDKENILDCGITEQEECDGQCVKAVVDVAGLTSISRSCSSNCVEGNLAGQGVFCCDSFLCNTAATTSPCSPSAFLSLLLASVLALFCNIM